MLTQSLLRSTAPMAPSCSGSIWPRRAVVVAAGVAWMLASAAGLSAQTPAGADPHTVQPERPTVATHAGSVAPGWLEIEAGLELDRYEDRSHGAVAPLLAKVGLAPRVQLNLQGPVVQPPGGSTMGVGDLSVGVKWRILDATPLVGDFAILPSVKGASGSADAGTGTGTTDVSLLFISSHTFHSVALDVNVGFTRRSGNGSLAPTGASIWTAALGGSAHGGLGWVAEVYGYPPTAGPAGATSIVGILGGPTLAVRRWLVLDAGLIFPIAGPQPRAVYGGLVYNVGPLWH